MQWRKLELVLVPGDRVCNLHSLLVVEAFEVDSFDPVGCLALPSFPFNASSGKTSVGLGDWGDNLETLALVVLVTDDLGRVLLLSLNLVNRLAEHLVFSFSILSEIDVGLHYWVHVDIELHFIFVRILAHLGIIISFSDSCVGTLDVEVLPRLVLASLFLVQHWRWRAFLVEQASYLVAEVAKEVSDWTQLFSDVFGFFTVILVFQRDQRLKSTWNTRGWDS